MAITTYSELQTALTNWTHRSDLTSIFPDLITIAESRINRKLRIREMETEADVTITAGTRTASLPSDFGEVRRFYLSTDPVTELDFMSPQDYWARYTSTRQGKPLMFTIEGSNLVLGPIPGSGYTGKLQYYRSLPALSSSAHSVFTSNPDLYLYGALTAGEAYLKNDKRFPLWKSQFEETMRELEAQSSRAQGPMVMRDRYNPY